MISILRRLLCKFSFEITFAFTWCSFPFVPYKVFLKRLKNLSENVFSAKSLAYYFCTYERWWNGKKWKDFRKVFQLLYFKLYTSIRVGVRRSNFMRSKFNFFMRSKFNFFMRSNLFNNNLTLKVEFRSHEKWQNNSISWLPNHLTSYFNLMKFDLMIISHPYTLRYSK